MSTEPKTTNDVTAEPNDETNDASGQIDGPKLATRRNFLKGVGATAAVAATGGVASAASEGWTGGRSGLNWDSDYVQNPYAEESGLTRARHRMKWNDSDEDPDTWLTYYEDDSGNKTQLPGYVPREDTENVLTVRADKFDYPGGRIFPRGEQYDEDGDGSADTDVSALDATHWTGTNSTNGTVSISNADLDVEKALRIASSGVPSGETVKATFTDVSVTDSAAKRFLQFVANVEVLNSGATVEVVARDDDGDEKIASANPSADTSNADVFAAATGNGFTFQERFNALATEGSGDGSFDSIAEVEVRISDADATLVFTGFDAERKSELVFGSYLANEGTDSEERRDRIEPGPGTFTITGFDTVGDVLGADGAVVHDVEQPFRYTLEASDLDLEYQFVKADEYPGYENRFKIRGKLEVPSAIELTHTGLTLLDAVPIPSGRYTEVWTKSGVEGTEFADMDDDTKTYHDGDYGNSDPVTLRSSISASTVIAYGADILVTSDEKSSIKDTSTGGGVAAQESEGPSWLVGGGILGILSGIAAKLGGWF